MAHNNTEKSYLLTLNINYPIDHSFGNNHAFIRVMNWFRYSRENMETTYLIRILTTIPTRNQSHFVLSAITPHWCCRPPHPVHALWIPRDKLLQKYECNWQETRYIIYRIWHRDCLRDKQVNSLKSIPAFYLVHGWVCE